MIAQQTSCFLQAILLGVILGAFYDAFRFLRVMIKSPVAVIFIEDALYFATAAFISFSFMLQMTDGEIRLFVLLGEAIGAILYINTIGEILFGIYKVIIGVIRKILKRVFGVILIPLKAVIGFIRKNIRKIKENLKKRIKNNKTRLKRYKGMVYNNTERKNGKGSFLRKQKIGRKQKKEKRLA